MLTFCYEIKKMFIHKRGILLIGLFFLIQIAGLLIFDSPVNPEVERNRASYNFYLQQMEGRCSGKTEKLISKEASRITRANSSLQKVYDDYYNGKLTEKEFHIQISALEAIVQNEKGFNIIYDQYTQIRKNAGNRYFLYTNGWDGLLSNDSLDLLLVLLLLLLITPVFCYEYESKMESLNMTERKGGRHHAMCKIGLVLLTVTLICLLEAGMRFAFFQVKYGLPQGEYPLQSLIYFNTSTKNITLLGAFIGISVGRLFGCLCFSVLIMFTSVCVKRYALTLFPCTAVILLPYYGFGVQSSKYFLPGPLGFMISTGYFRGNEHKIINPYTKEKLVVFQEVSRNAIILLLAINLFIAVAMLAIVLIKHTNVWCKKSIYHWRGRHLCLALMLSVTVCGITGCETGNRAGEHSIYNMESNGSFENQKYRFYVKDSDSDGKQIFFQNKETGEIQNLVRDPMRRLTKVPGSIYGDGSYVYYMEYDCDTSQFWDTFETFRIIQVDTRNFAEKIVFERSINTERDSFLGLGRAKDSDARFYNDIQAFFVDEHSIYFVHDDQICRVDRLTGRMRVIIDSPILKIVAFDGRNIYYANPKSRVMRYDTRTNMEAEIPGIVTNSFLLMKDKLIYLNRRDQNRIYKMTLETGTIRKITNAMALEFILEGETIVYTDKVDLKKHRIRP